MRTAAWALIGIFGGALVTLLFPSLESHPFWWWTVLVVCAAGVLLGIGLLNWEPMSAWYRRHRGVALQHGAGARPNIAVHSVRLLPEERGPATQQPPVAEFAIVNAGSGGCTITESAVDLGYYRPAEKPYFLTLPRNDIIRPQPFEVGATDTVTVRSGQASAIHHAEVMFRSASPSEPEYDRTLYLSGWIKYLEPGPVPRTTYFRRMYDQRANSFGLTGDPEDERTY